MIADKYQTLFEHELANGLVPLRVSVKGTGKAANFNAVFGRYEETTPHIFRSRGPNTVPAVDAVMETWLRDNNIRGTALAILDGARLVYAKGYTWAEPEYPNIQPTTLFRQASCSKVFTAYALYCLLQERIKKIRAGVNFAQLMSESTLQSVLKLTQPNGQPPKDAKFGKITLLDLITSTSGLNQHLLWRSSEAAAAANQPLPATRMQVASYAAAQTFSATPGDSKNVVYGNFDYFLLGEVVRAMSGAPTFEAALETLILTPLQMTRVRGSRSLIEDQRPGEALYHLTQPENEGLPELAARKSLRTPSQPLVAAQYGATDMEMIGACGGLSVAVTDMARLIASLSVRIGNAVLQADTIDQWLMNAAIATKTLSGPAAHGYHGWDWVRESKPNSGVFSGGKGGILAGTETQVYFTTGGLSYIMMAGDVGRAGAKGWSEPLKQVAEAQNWESIDLFPLFGMSSFPLQSPAKRATEVEDLMEPLRNGPSGCITFPSET